jgi:hypothetical protein
MTERIELPDNAWAELRNPRTVPERLRRPVTQMMFSIANNQEIQNAENDVVNSELVGIYSELNDLVIVARVAAWSFDLPISVDGVLDLPGNAYEVLQEKTVENVLDMIPNFGQSNDPESPTKPSDA